MAAFVDHDQEGERDDRGQKEQGIEHARGL
jgi:hypothetical protein